MYRKHGCRSQPESKSINFKARSLWILALLTNYIGKTKVSRYVTYDLCVFCQCLESEAFYIQRVARWHIFKPQIPLWVNFGGSCNGRSWSFLPIAIWSILWQFFIHRYVDFWYILWLFAVFFHFWYVVTRKIWQPWFYKLVKDMSCLPRPFYYVSVARCERRIDH
jgi:hypothetical protein